ncbi:Trehalase [Phytophthora cactorum]|uniref:Trehalase n=1 Tax=Phytophthora cactorum TaxID=29920 RepID=A0A329RS97_9STRA|nr:Trehalase [Phytophthora cactorum]KAG2955503.1 Trehalase [Phytophthora cactorum]KAG3191574.1 Trehalase [Phytophthora cactorum]KAG3220664.1 Trehalase [Phytophthora cactorum]RAW27543.1 Trehalase [Phytophthora cactorum]
MLTTGVKNTRNSPGADDESSSPTKSITVTFSRVTFSITASPQRSSSRPIVDATGRIGMISHNGSSPSSSLLLLLLFWSVASSLALGRRYIRPVPDPVKPELMSVERVSNAVANTRQQQIQQLQRVYCRGELLHEVQMHQLFPDSKHFVDMPIKATSSVDDVLTQFQELKASFDNKTTGTVWKAQLAAFVDHNFDPPGAELAPVTPPDYKEGEIPHKIRDITDERLRGWAMELHKLWKVLARVPASTSADQTSRSSFLHSLPIDAVPDDALARQFNGENVLVVPGGRFRESYYWDSYWIVQGLLVSGLRQTARGVVNHLLEYVAEFGFVPNGGRVYYLTRSQPPLLSDMVRVVAKLEDGNGTDDASAWDLQYLRVAVPLLEREYDFWMHRGDHGHAVEVTGSSSSQSESETFVLNRYVAHAGEPRPESYREDVSTASSVFSSQSDAADKKLLYNEIIAAAESGWDFSSRWFGDYSTLPTIRTSQVIPVELNAILHRVEINLANFHELLGNPIASTRFRDAAKTRVKAMDAVLWSESDGCWKDYLLDSREHSPVVSMSNYSPLWGGAFDASDSSRLERIVESLERSGLVQEGGIQTTTSVTGQQWDAPNAWPPLQDIVIEGLQAAGTATSRALAKSLVQRWVKAGFVAWQKTGLMFEKYNAQQLGGVGDGGEYTPQFGFGWSNGVILTFLTKYQAQLGDTAAILGSVDV